MTEEELDKLIELKKTQAKAIEFDRTEEEFVEEFFRTIVEQLSEKSGVSRATISALENGKAEITTTDTLLKLAKALNRRVSDIFLA